MKKEKRVRAKIKPITKILLCLIVVALIVGGFLVWNNFIKPKNNKMKVVDSIKNKDVDYIVSENDTKIFKSTFNELKKVLNEKEVDNKKYAETITKLFVIDFFTLSNKTSKNDVGGVQFVYDNYKTDFVEGARNSIYKQVHSNVTDDKSNSSLPTVTKVTIDDIDEISPYSMFEGDLFTEDQVGYMVNISWEYKNKDDFQKNATIIVVPDGKKLSIGRMQEAM
jgi:hypothetical protein